METHRQKNGPRLVTEAPQILKTSPIMAPRMGLRKPANYLAENIQASIISKAGQECTGVGYISKAKNLIRGTPTTRGCSI
jgi:hypothetical protein